MNRSLIIDDCSARQFREPVKPVVIPLCSKEVASTADKRFRVPLATTSFLSSVCQVYAELTCAYGAPHTPFLPPVFEERLPSLSAMPEIFFTVARGFNIGFFGLDRSQLTLYINSPVVLSFFLEDNIYGNSGNNKDEEEDEDEESDDEEPRG